MTQVCFNPDPSQNFSYQNAINECRRIGSAYKFVRFENGGLMLCINSPTSGWLPYRGSVCEGKAASAFIS